MRKALVIGLILVCSLGNLYSQHYPAYSQYLFSGLVINPAYTGSRDVMSVGLLYRNQWSDIEGSPIDQVLSIHAPLRGDKVALGLLVQNDKIGVSRTTGIFPNFAYRIFFNDNRNSTLSFGLKGGIVLSNTAWNEIKPIDDSDPVFSNSEHNFALPDFGSGLYFYNDVFFAGFSVPGFFTFVEEQGYTIKNDFKKYNYLFTMGGLIAFSDEFKLKPSTLLKYESSSGIQTDINMNFIFMDKFWIGAGYRIQGAAVFLADLQINNQIKLGYTYDYSFGDITKYLGGSHEITLIYDFNFKIEAANPRYF